mmetsp:Transcript_65834/g.195924  ORF Transcript_65834/g.195924 Transcript_65834/m.195924 type:complete len:207 (+) Transcript_65834:114-734(+)
MLEEELQLASLDRPAKLERTRLLELQGLLAEAAEGARLPLRPHAAEQGPHVIATLREVGGRGSQIWEDIVATPNEGLAHPVAAVVEARAELAEVRALHAVHDHVAVGRLIPNGAPRLGLPAKGCWRCPRVRRHEVVRLVHAPEHQAEDRRAYLCTVLVDTSCAQGNHERPNWILCRLQRRDAAARERRLLGAGDVLHRPIPERHAV